MGMVLGTGNPQGLMVDNERVGGWEAKGPGGIATDGNSFWGPLMPPASCWAAMPLLISPNLLFK